jgi:hypothetical protein
MKYCVRTESFEFNPLKYSSVEQAYYELNDNNTKIITLFENLELADEYLKSCKPELRIYRHNLAYAKIYIITECDWYFDESYYSENEIEKTFNDLELFDDVVFLAMEIKSIEVENT